MIKKLALIILIGILALFLRWYASVSLSIDYDEPTYYKAASAYATAFRTGQPGQILQYSFNYEHPILAKLIYGAVLAVLPPDNLPPTGDKLPFKALRPLSQTRAQLQILWLRKISVGFGTLQVILLGLVSPLAALLLAVHSMTIKYTSVIYLEALPAFASTASALLFSRTLDFFRAKEGFPWRADRRQILWLVLSAACLGIAVAAKYQYAVVGLALSIYGLFLIARSRSGVAPRLGLLFVWGLLALAIFVLADPYLWPSPAARLAQSLNFSVQYTQGQDVQEASYPFYQPFIWLAKSAPAQPSLAVPADSKAFPFQLDTLIAVLALLGLPRLAKKNPLMLTWLAVGIVFLLLWTTKWPQYVLTISTPLCFAAAEGILTLVQAILPRLPKLAWLVSLTLLLSGCAVLGTDLDSTGGVMTPFRPPVDASTAAPLATPQLTPHTSPMPSAAGMLATTPAPCLNSLNYLEDLTLPDRTVVAPGQSLDKRWQVENTGSCNWDERYQLRLIAGPNLGAAAEQPLYPARSGMQAVLRILFTAPAEPGTYRSAWQAHDPQGRPFGDPFFIEVVVRAATPAP
ncbi:MAG TPA: NBR1-Ig-like domain-containing protein [Anaerolineales bacterium]